MRSFPYKLAAIDIDDTLIGRDKKISPANFAAVQKLQDMGVRVILASGREHHNMMCFHRELGLKDFVVSAQGALARHSETGEVLHRRPVSTELKNFLLEAGEDLGLSVLFCTLDKMYVNKLSHWVEVNETYNQGEAVEVTDLRSLKEAPLKIMWCADPKDIQILFKEIEPRLRDRSTFFITTPYFLEFMDLHATKATGVEAVARHYGIAREEILAFGDGSNDVPILKWAGMGVAMPNGLEEAKVAAKRIGPAGDPETALARAIEELVL